METVNEAVAERFPGVSLESEIQGWVFLEEFEEGVVAYVKLQEPTAKDDRWLGVCYFQLFRDLDALEALYRAINRGEDAARINAAHLLKFVERGDEAEAELQKVDVASLCPYDSVLYYRVLSLHEETNGNLRDALRAAEEAWRRVQGIPEFALLAPAILGQLAILHGRIGRSQRALWFLERGLQFKGARENLKVRLVRAGVLINLGRYQEAQAELESIDLTKAPTFQVEQQFLHGELSWATGNIESAVQEFSATAQSALGAQASYEEFQSRLALVSIFAFKRDFGPATENMSRAQALISDRSDRLLYRFREVLLLHSMETYTHEHAIEEFEALVAEFGDIGLLQEEGAVRLHIASIKLGLGDSTYITELDRVQALSVSLQNQAFLSKEWTLLPQLREVAAATHKRIAGRRTTVLEVYTLGQERLLLGAKPVNIPLRRGVEVLAYFLENRAVTLKRLLGDIFPDDKPRSAKSYFHQFRHQLRENVDGLEIEYDSESKMYRLKSEIDIVWDVSELRAGRIMGETGIFLPSSGNDWALVVEQSLDAYREAVGVLEPV
jgi:tetratricopeptide (TPR) repeat protein